MSYINLSRTRLTDADLADLADLSDIDALDLSDTSISDTGLAHLKCLTRLALLVLDGTAVTPAGVADFRRALPDTTILYTRITIPREASRAEQSSAVEAILSLPILPVPDARLVERW